ncbi:MAG: hypothetical protein QXX30_02925 [Candidatus Aenigmatarchaeota archaeon]
MQKFYLHIGFPKTGSSALQHWLHNNNDLLLRLGIYYPTFGAPPLKPSQQTVGNGGLLINLLHTSRHNEFHRFLSKLKEDAKGLNILISSERFHELRLRHIVYLKELIKNMEMELVVIAYIRDIYEWSFSRYKQVVRNHLFSESFRDFALSIDIPGIFSSIQAWSTIFPDIRVLHYDTVKSYLLESFLSAIDLDISMIKNRELPISNRSLTLEETVIMREINKILKEHFEPPQDLISWSICNLLVENYPNSRDRGEILYCEDVIKFIEENYQQQINWINNRFFNGRQILKIFNSKNKNIVYEEPTISESTLSIIRSMLDFFSSYYIDRFLVCKIIYYLAPPNSQILRKYLESSWYRELNYGVKSDPYKHWYSSGWREGRLVSPNIAKFFKELVGELENVKRKEESV